MYDVSVVMGVWQTPPRYLRAAIQSVLEQAHRSFELIIIEDLSSESAGDVIRELDDPRIRHRLREARGGLTSALREGVSMARAPFIARLDGDDICEPQRLAVQLKYLEEHPDISVVGSALSIIDEEDHIVGRRRYPLTHDNIASTMRRYNCIAHPSVMFRKADVEAVGGYDIAQPLEDYELWCRMIAAGYRFANLPDALVHYRFHFESLRSTRVHDVIRDTIAVKERYFRGRFTLGDRLRIAIERALLLLPPRIVLWLFRKWQYDE